MSPAPLRDRLLELMNKPGYTPMNKSELSRTLEISSTDRPKLRKILQSLEKEDLIVAGRKGRYESTESEAGLLRGAIKFQPNGHAWFFPEPGNPENVATGHDLEKLSRIFTPRRHAGNALDGDRVLVSLREPRLSAKQYRRNRSRGGIPEGDDPEVHAIVEKIIERRSGKMVGTYQKGGKKGWVKADDSAYQGSIELIGDSTARPGQIVVVQIENWQHKTPHGRIIEVLGWPGDAGVDIMSIIHRNGIRTSFPDEVLGTARAIPDEVDPDEVKKREDWRDRLVITIDPADAKDHDDAIWVEKTRNGWQLAVHIADVSHYVKPRSPLDVEAAKRGNSTYLVDRVVPMLPVELSNGLCSLKPDVDRLTKCAVLDVNRQGKVVKSRFCNAVIHSQAKLSYEQAQTILDGGKAPENSYSGLEELVREAWAMASRIRKRRFKDGALDLEMQEIRVKLADDGRASHIEKVEHTESHQLIEECMLVANENVARILKQRNKPAIYRIHEDPDFGRLQEYGETAAAFGYDFGDLTNKAHIQQLLDAAKGKPDEHAIKIGLLKSLKRAAYSPDPLGHYGLSKGDYCHFTSPIRRYADLIVHRALQPFLDNPPKRADRNPPQAELSELARHISDTERASADAENESKQIKLLEYLEATISKKDAVVFEGLITEVRAMGLMVEATGISTRGMIRREDLPGGGPWRFEASQARLVGPGSRQYQMGQRIQMEVSHINHDRRFIDFCIAGEKRASSRNAGRHTRNEPTEKPTRRTAKKTSRRSTKQPAGKRPTTRKRATKKRTR